MRILFFDDFPYASENRLFRSRIEHHFPDIAIDFARTPSQFMDLAAAECYDLIVLDIMAAWDIQGEESETFTASTTGIELLRRIRSGDCGATNRTTKIVMRTARGESHIREQCFALGADAFCRAGIDDSAIIEMLESL